MAWRIEKQTGDIIIDGFENGIADDPYEGLADMRNINSLSTPKEAAVSFSTAAVTMPPTVTAVAFTAYPNTISGTALVVGGGSGGGGNGSGDGGGGGGAGGVQTITVNPTNGVGVTITVGTGGDSTHVGGQSAYGVTTSGGGGYGGGIGTVDAANGGAGSVAGSGGGAPTGRGAGTGTFSGGTASGAGGGGGGGSSGAGQTVAGNAGGNGGTGTSSSISGSAVNYGIGGGGGANTGAGGTGGTTPGSGGQGRAGDGGISNTPGQNGIVIISVQQGLIASATGGTHTTSGGNDIWTFTTSGTWTPTFNTFTANTVTVASTANWYAGMAVIINTLTNGAPLSATAGSNTFYVLVQSPGVILLYTDLACTTVVTLTQYGTGTLSTATFGNPVDWSQGPVNNIDPPNNTPTFIIDSVGQAWMLGNGTEGYALNTLQFCGNTNSTTIHAPPSNGLGIAVWQGYLLLFIDTASGVGEIDCINIDNTPGGDVPGSLLGTGGPNGNWNIGGVVNSSDSSVPVQISPTGHKTLVAGNNRLYYCNGNSIGSITAVGTFEPDDPTSYTLIKAAVVLPYFEWTTCIAQLGASFLIGGSSNYIYPYDGVITLSSSRLIIAESYSKRIVSTNSVAYVFAGTRGRIYVTNGSQISLFKKFPDQLSGTETPYYTWTEALYYRNQLYFALTATDNAGNTLSTFAGIWALSLEMATSIGNMAYGSSAGPLKLLNSISNGSYAGSVPVIAPMGNINAQGHALYMGWINGSSVSGIDYSQNNPYTNYEAYINTDIIPVGTFLNPKTNKQIEYKLSKPLVTGESIRVAWRGNLTDTFTTVGTWTSTGLVAEYMPINFQQQQWVQLQISMASTTTTPSFNRLREIRLR